MTLEEIPSQPKTISDGGGRVWIYAQEIKGRFQRLRTIIAYILLVLLYAVPWIKMNGNPFLRLSFFSSHYYILGHHVSIYENKNLVLLVLLLVVTLFWSSAIFGRLWCGYACPQTIFIEHLFRKIEFLIEGDSFHRKKIDAMPWTTQKIFKKSVKYCIFALIAISFGATVVMIFSGTELIVSLDWRALIATAIISFLAFLDGAYLREQFCNIVCPYARFQSVMQDRHTITIGYDSIRGEPRKRGNDRTGAGDCISCSLCVRVCPAGIDIRQGVSQQECVGCARCIDACDSVMESLGKPAGLIRYDIEKNFSDNKKRVWLKSILRPRVIVYTVILLSLTTIGMYRFLNRQSTHIMVISPSVQPYFIENDRIKNMFNLKITNQSDAPQGYSISIDFGKIETPTVTTNIMPGEEIFFPVVVSMERASDVRTLQIKVVSNVDKKEFLVNKPFLKPGKE